MCGPTSIKSPAAGQNRSLLMLSVEDFSGHNGVPSVKAQMTTTAFLILLLVAVEMSLRQILTSIKHLHPIFEDETGRQILARHIGVDALAAIVVTYLGWTSRHVMQDLIDATIGGKKNAMPVAYEGRMFTYRPESQRIAVFFVAYQLKNTYDTLVWNDGALFIAHHVLTLFTTWGGLMGNAHFYIPFYFGVSELSTGVLCLLANFDDEHGVVGLGDAFPMTKVVLGGMFAVLFIICRVLMWSRTSYFYCQDAYNTQKGSDPRLKGYKTWFQFTLFSLGFLTFLQIVWLAEIGRVAKEELEKIGLI